MDDFANPRTQAIVALAQTFFEKSCRSTDLSQLKSNVIDMGHNCVAKAFGLALEALDTTSIRSSAFI